ncbi:MAG: hypothetical protein AMXMBFR34_13720 [Myxococcaceae bacterium]
MNRSLALSLCLVVSLPAAAESWNKKLDAWRSAAYAERKKLGLDKDRKALYAKYPTPEVKFASGSGGPAAAGLIICPDETKNVTLAGKLAPGSFVSVNSDELEVVKEAFTAKGWEATLHAKKTATPTRIDVQVFSPVSTASKYLGGLAIGCDHTWIFEVSGGDTLVVKSKYGVLEEVKVTGEWKRGDKVLGQASFRMWAGSGNVRLDQEVSQADQMAQAKAMMDLMKSPEMKSIDAKSEAVSKKMGECGKLHPDKMEACFAGPQKEIEALSKQREELMAKLEIKSSPPFGCRRIDTNAKDGLLSGEAELCAGKRSSERVKVTGRYTAP